MTSSFDRLGCALAFALLSCSSSTSPGPSSGTPTGTDKDSGGSSPAQDTWANYASSFVQTYCVSCHDSSDPTGRDFTVEENFRKSLDEIRCGVAVAQDASWNCKTFPPAEQFPIGSGPKPSNADRERFVAWITSGAP
jgi:hypothetical protein